MFIIKTLSNKTSIFLVIWYNFIKVINKCNTNTYLLFIYLHFHWAKLLFHQNPVHYASEILKTYFYNTINIPISFIKLIVRNN